MFVFYNLLCRNIIVYFSFSINSLLAFPTFLMDTFLIDEWNSNHYINVIGSHSLNVCNFFSTYLSSLIQGVPVFCDFRIRDPAILWFISDTNFVNSPPFRDFQNKSKKTVLGIHDPHSTWLPLRTKKHEMQGSPVEPFLIYFSVSSMVADETQFLLFNIFLRLPQLPGNFP